jgi:PilZ domain
MTMPERRDFTRIAVEIEIKVENEGTTVSSDRLRDIGLGGAFIVTEDKPSVGSPLDLTLSVVGPSSFLRMEVQAEVIRQDDNGVAIEFTKIDVDSLIHLHHLIKIHSRDPGVVDKEFVHNLIGEK